MRSEKEIDERKRRERGDRQREDAGRTGGREDGGTGGRILHSAQNDRRGRRSCGAHCAPLPGAVRVGGQIARATGAEL